MPPCFSPKDMPELPLRNLEPFQKVESVPGAPVIALAEFSVSEAAGWKIAANQGGTASTSLVPVMSGRFVFKSSASDKRDVNHARTNFGASNR